MLTSGRVPLSLLIVTVFVSIFAFLAGSGYHMDVKKNIPRLSFRPERVEYQVSLSPILL
jgi:hypothetical protein